MAKRLTDDTTRVHFNPIYLTCNYLGDKIPLRPSKYHNLSPPRPVLRLANKLIKSQSSLKYCNGVWKHTHSISVSTIVAVGLVVIWISLFESLVTLNKRVLRNSSIESVFVLMLINKQLYPGLFLSWCCSHQNDIKKRGNSIEIAVDASSAISA